MDTAQKSALLHFDTEKKKKREVVVFKPRIAAFPGLVVQRPRPLCAPLPTWAAPATPPRAGHVVDEKDSGFGQHVSGD